MVGGSMYALEYGLNAKWAGILFAAFTVIASFGIGSTVQSNAISTLANEVLGVPFWISGAIVTLLVGLVIFGGIKSIANVCGALVPFMAVIYIIGCIVLLIMNWQFVWPAIKLIVMAAFNPEAATGGFVGGTFMIAARYGIARGLFSNESGLGSAPIVAASAKTKNAVRQALVSSTGTFWDTVVICAITGIVIVSSVLSEAGVEHAADPNLGQQFNGIMSGALGNIDGSTLTKHAFNKIPLVGQYVLLFGLFTFAFSTILGWVVYASRALEYIFNYSAVKYFKMVYLAAVFLGAVISLSIVWTLADVFNALMAIPNIFALLLLNKVLRKETDYYLWGNHLDEEQ